jgi:hypothetical protein
VAASGAIVDVPLAAVSALNAVALQSAQASYALMEQILTNNEAPLIFTSLPISAAAITAGLVAFETTLAAAAAANARAGLVAPAP